MIKQYETASGYDLESRSKTIEQLNKRKNLLKKIYFSLRGNK